MSTDTAFFEAYAVGLVCASVCTDLPLDAATARLNHDYPTGISSPWEPSQDATFADGQPNPCPCDETPGRTHYLFNC